VRLSFRFLVPLVLAFVAIAYAVTPVVEGLMRQWHMRDLDIRATLVANSLQEALRETPGEDEGGRLSSRLTNLIRDERLYGIAICRTNGTRLAASTGFPEQIRCAPANQPDRSSVVNMPQGPLHVAARDLMQDGQTIGSLIVVHDMSFAERRSEATKRYLFYLIAAIAILVSIITIAIAEFSWREMLRGVRTMLTHRSPGNTPAPLPAPELAPVAQDLRSLIQDLEAARGLRDAMNISWSPEALRNILRHDLHGEEVIILSNREPYIHDRRDEKVVVRRPASGLVTALEPVMRACSGTWIAHGGGSADKETVDRHDHVRVPPDKPAYTLRRIWLTKEQEEGYYYGFANSGLWPLCHIAHVRPTFRTSDWSAYERVNRKFADAVVEEARTPDPVVLVQDYHLALVPRMIREQLPDATIITFWHIPWPNPEAFAICPQREELLDGLLGSSILGFHTQFHCNNFVDTVDRQLEARVDRETFGVSYRGERTLVKRYPISVEWPPSEARGAHPVEVCRGLVRAQLGLPPDQAIGVGVDRLDYTKGLEERFRGVERLLELHPDWIGRFTFVQIAAPTRGRIEQYQAYEHRVRELVGRINARFANRRAPAIILLAQHHDAHQVFEYYRAAELCFVSSLHDGMNLVAKEFVASRDDEAGVLILSQFTGAARELPEALIVNPYDAEQCAHALDAALTMPLRMQRARMRLMRGLIHEFNVYRWAGRMLLDAATVRRRGRFANRPLWPIKHTRASDATRPASTADGPALGRRV
jgi:trehalose 6-phosphate synthase